MPGLISVAAAHAPYLLLLVGAALFNASLGGPRDVSLIRDALPSQQLTAPLGIAFALMLGGWTAILLSHRRPGRAAVITYATLIVAVFLLTPAALSIDLLDYIRRGRVLAFHGANPHVTPPGQFPADPFHSNVGWHFIPTPYGPVFTLLSAALSALAGDGRLLNVLAFKLVMAASHAGNALVIRRITSSPRATLAYLLNPFVLVEGVAMAHNDVMAMFPVLIALRFAQRERFVSAAGALAIAVNIKAPLGILFLPWLGHVLYRADARAGTLARSGAVAAAATFLLWLPFYAGPQTFALQRAAASLHTKWSTPTLLAALLSRLFGPVPAAGIFARAICNLSVVAGAGVAASATRNWVAHARHAAALLFLVPAVGMAWVFPWYLIWALAVLPLTRSAAYRAVEIAVVLGGLSHYVLLTRSAFVSSPAENALLGILTLGPGFVAFALALARADVAPGTVRSGRLGGS